MLVRDLMTQQVATCLAGDYAIDAARLMDSEDRGALFVLADDGSRHVVGVLTDRDICLAVARGEPELAGLEVRALMSGDPHTCRETDDIAQALRAIEACGRRRLAVVDASGQLLGAVTLTDLAKHAVAVTDPSISAGEVCRTLVACAAHRRDAEHLLLR